MVNKVEWLQENWPDEKESGRRRLLPVSLFWRKRGDFGGDFGVISRKVIFHKSLQDNRLRHLVFPSRIAHFIKPFLTMS